MRANRRSAAGPLTAALAAALAVLGLTVAAAQDGPAPARAPGYLGSNVPDPAVFIPPPPAAGSPAEAVDNAAFDSTRRLEGSARWLLATRDAALTPSAGLADFQCAIGVSLTEANAPRLLALITKMGRDTGTSVERGKDEYRRPRPLTVRPGAICVDNREAIGKSFSYPSGHSTWGWSVALILSELAPDRAGQILARGRAYGESRVVCGVHYVSDVEAGRSNGAGLVAALHADGAFQADMAAARAELSALRAGGSGPAAGAQCDVQSLASAQTPW
ncbi:MAG: phosphatase PAP2 family protein [Caulobacteraceae bacterium]